MENWWFLLLEFAVAITLILMSGRQPFPGPSKRYGITLLIIALLLLIGETGPRPTDVQVHLFVMLIYGSFGLVRGVHNMLRSHLVCAACHMHGLLAVCSANF